VYKNYPGPATIETCTTSITKTSKEIIVSASAVKHKIARILIVSTEDWWQTSPALFVPQTNALNKKYCASDFT
jgi:hypothetical protein